ncbi:MAG: carboxypeptidase M32 [Nitrososphaeria archaeon]
MEKPFQNKLVLEVLERYKVVWSIEHAMALLSWDSETYMPEDGVEERSVAFSQLDLLKQKFLTEESFMKLVDRANEEKDLNEYEKGVLRVLNREIRVYRLLPPKLVEELAKVTQEAKIVWRNARIANNFQAFQPYLEKIFSLSRECAECLGYKEHPYDALLDLYEEGLTSRDVTQIFDSIKSRLKILLERIQSEKLFSGRHPLEDLEYDKSVMEKVNLWVAEKLGYDKKRFRIDVSAHPFTIHMGLKDVRITTRYEGKDFKSTLFSTIHEYGHALYGLQHNEAFTFTPLANGASLGLHESQSRFWENIIGRSREFCTAIYPFLKENLNLLENYSIEDLYRYFNIVRPTLIRVDADEVTYNFHILVRYNLEKALIKNEVRVTELPTLWNSMIEETLGIRPKTDSEGVLQDIHWSLGSIGYFPTYTIGTILSAQVRHNILKDVPDFYEKISRLEFSEVKEWLRRKIHYWGAMYPPKELIKRMLGEDINPEYFIRYLEEKYLLGC